MTKRVNNKRERQTIKHREKAFKDAKSDKKEKAKNKTMKFLFNINLKNNLVDCIFTYPCFAVVN